MTDADRWGIELVVNGIIGAVTVAALIVALVQVRDAQRQAAAARVAVATERRLTFELQLLAQMYDQWGTTGTTHLGGYINALIRDPADEEDLPLLRAATGIKPSSSSRSLLDSFRRGTDAFDDEIRRELDDAITRRLTRDAQ